MGRSQREYLGDGCRTIHHQSCSWTERTKWHHQCAYWPSVLPWKKLTHKRSTRWRIIKQKSKDCVTKKQSPCTVPSTWEEVWLKKLFLFLNVLFRICFVNLSPKTRNIWASIWWLIERQHNALESWGSTGRVTGEMHIKARQKETLTGGKTENNATYLAWYPWNLFTFAPSQPKLG